MPGRHTLLQNAIYLDTETLGLHRGSGLHELAIFNLESQAVYEYVLKPNMVVVAAATAQENTRLATSALDKHKLVQKSSWMDIIRHTMEIQGQVAPGASQDELNKAMQVANPWLAKAMGKYPHLTGRVESQSERVSRLQLMQTQGVASFTSEQISAADLLKSGGPLQRAIEGKTLWLQNANFDSKQVGALVAGLHGEGVQTALKRTLQTAGPTTDPFYVTGVEVNRAKVLAQQSGDWTGVWKAYLNDAPKPGEAAVRDIQDVVRSMMSYGQKLGLTQEGDVYWGTSLDLMYRLMGSQEANPDVAKQILGSAEHHRAAEDLAIHSHYVLQKSLDYTTALQQVHENTPAGQALMAEARQGKGTLYEAAAFLKRQELLKPEIQHISLVKRLARAQQDLIEQGVTHQVDGWSRVTSMSQLTSQGVPVELPFLQPNRIPMNSLDEVVKLMQVQGKYGADNTIAAEAAAMVKHIGGESNPFRQKELLGQYLESKTTGVLEGQIAAKSEQIMKTYNRNLGKLVSRSSVSSLREMLPSRSGVMAGVGVAAGAIAGAGFLWSLTSGNAKPTRDQPSLVSYNYDQWLEKQSEFSAMRSESEQMDGMSERGVAGALRRRNTDFGSPYVGIQGSQLVFHQQKIRDEREKWLRRQYGATFYDPVSGLFGMQGILSRARHEGYSYLPDGEQVANGYGSLNGNHLMRVNLGDGNWQMSVEDADTITLKRGGLRGIVSSLFGLNKGYSFRLAGVDSPEIEHPGSAFGAQPHAYKSLEGLRSLLGDGRDTELVFDPTQNTYGRAMGVLFSGGKNVNFELLKRGWAGHLPYGKPSNSIIDYSVMKGMETGAAAVSRGMWQHPYWKVLYDTTKGGDRPTFNTLTKEEKIVENVSTMDMVALAQQAEDQGFYSTAEATEAARIGMTRHRGVDEVKPVVQGPVAAHYDGYMQGMLYDTNTWMQSKGGHPNNQSYFSARSGYRSLDKAMVLDSMGQTNSVWSRRRLSMFDRYGAGQPSDRKYRMASAQQMANKTMFDSQQNHYLMNGSG